MSGEVMKVAWIRNADVPAGQPALGRFDCPCGNTITDVEFGGIGETCQGCGREYDGRGWIVRGPREMQLRTIGQGEGLLGWPGRAS